MFNSSSDENNLNISVSDVHIGLDTNNELEYIEDYDNGTYDDLNHTAKDYCVVSQNESPCSLNQALIWLVNPKPLTHLLSCRTTSKLSDLMTPTLPRSAPSTLYLE